MDDYLFNDVKPVLISVVIVLSIATNGLVIIIIARYPALRQDRTSLFMFSLCLSDLACGCTAMPISAALCSSATPNVRSLPGYLPKIQRFFFWWFGFISLHSQSWVALSKMIAIVSPFGYDLLLTRNRCCGIIVLNWVIGAALWQHRSSPLLHHGTWIFAPSDLRQTWGKQRCGCYQLTLWRSSHPKSP